MLVRRLTVLFLTRHHSTKQPTPPPLGTSSQVLVPTRTPCSSTPAITSTPPRCVGRTILLCCRSSSSFAGGIIHHPTTIRSTNYASVAGKATLLMSSQPHQQQQPPSVVPASPALPSWYRRANLAHLGLATSSKVIGTHSGTFQADEAMGVWMIQQLPEYWNARVVRTRDETRLSQLDLVLDVGGVYDPSIFRYDHHQRNYDERFDNNCSRCTKLSASGLIYRHYGKAVISTYYPDLPSDQVDIAYVKLYNALLEALDAIDTGVEMCPAGVVPLYKDATGLAARVSRLNPRWNEVEHGSGDGTTPPPTRRPSEDERFEQAVQLCGIDFMSVLTHVVEADLPAQALVEAAIRNRHDVDASGKIVVFPNGGMPWRTHLYEAERQFNVDPLIQFVLYQDTAGMYVTYTVWWGPRRNFVLLRFRVQKEFRIHFVAHTSLLFVSSCPVHFRKKITSQSILRWRVQAVTVEGKSFENRVSLPEAWRGLRDDVLVSITGIPGSRFVHAAGFIGGHDNYEGALAMAQAAVQ